MPSRFNVLLIVAFWLATVGYVVYGEIRLRYFQDTPPSVAIEITDEATPLLPVRWDMYRGDKQVGTLSTTMQHVPADDSFRFVNKFRDINMELVAGVYADIPAAEIVIHVSRDGDFKEQHMSGRGTLKGIPLTVEGTGSVDSRVENRKLVGNLDVDSNFGKFKRPLEPVPVPSGQVLNPMLPLNRVKDVYPGKRWTIHLVDPLKDSFKLMLIELLKEQKLSNLIRIPPPKPEELRAEVQSKSVTLDRPAIIGGPVECWVIEYKGSEAKVRTYVAVKDGRVIRQEATLEKETLRIDRRD